MYTAGLDSWFDSLNRRVCEHAKHAKVAGGEKSGSKWNSSSTAAYPPDFNSFVAQAFASFVRQRQPSGLEAEIAAPNALKQRVPSGSASAQAPSVPAPVSLPLDDLMANSSSAAATDAATTRELNFDDHVLGDMSTKNQVPRNSPTRSTDHHRRLNRQSLRSGSRRPQVRVLPEATTPLCFAAWAPARASL